MSGIVTNVPIAVSCVSLAVSGVTAYLTLFRKGTLKMTRPALVFFGPDDRQIPKVFMRTLLYRRNENDVQIFDTWHYGALARIIHEAEAAGRHGMNCRCKLCWDGIVTAQT